MTNEEIATLWAIITGTVSFFWHVWNFFTNRARLNATATLGNDDAERRIFVEVKNNGPRPTSIYTFALRTWNGKFEKYLFKKPMQQHLSVIGIGHGSHIWNVTNNEENYKLNEGSYRSYMLLLPSNEFILNACNEILIFHTMKTKPMAIKLNITAIN